MPTDHRAELKKIRTFPSLVRYLRDEMAWPIDSGNFEELTFEYTPEELGIDSASAAKIQEIKRLRPLSPNQPWGIFFIKFEPRKLPVVALRRILSRVALKKRASANSAERAAWAADDLLFISNYGEGEERRISFAHFTQDEAKGDLPTLKVLGWDNLDTALHLDEVADKLTRSLSWPAEEKDVAAWRSKWRSAFTLRHREVIATSRDLSIRLAELARAIRDRIKAGLKIETERGPLTKLLKAFQEALIHDLDADGFADMYAQTVAYGLLSARIANPKANTADHLPAQIPVTNPFLKELMETFLHIGGRRGKAGGPGIDFDELGVSEVVELLDDANMEAVVRDFGDRNPQEDPVVHFYEHFLAAYDKKQKVSRGVFYTPRPVVSYIVRAVDEVLRAEFGLEDGLADTTTWGEMAKRHKDLKVPNGVDPHLSFIQILDPATGTGTFLVEVIDLIYRRMREKWKSNLNGAKIEALWNEYVPKHLLPRLHGYELLMAPYAIAHLKVGLKLYETGYRFGSNERARIYLTNALEPATDSKRQIEFEEWIPALAHEAEAVDEVKRNRRYTVVIGNPPYSNFGRLNNGPWIQGLLEEYKKGLGERKLNLDDDYIKFIRLGQALIDSAAHGVLGLISANSYLDGAGHRGMRQALLASFTRIWILNLHGNLRRKEVGPAGGKEENVFDIMQGVAVVFMAKPPTTTSHVSVEYGDLWGSRASKYGALAIAALPRERIPVRPGLFLLIPRSDEFSSEYEDYPSLKDLFVEVGQGIEMGRTVALRPSKEEMKRVVSDLKAYSNAAFSQKYDVPVSSATWGIDRARADVQSSSGRYLELMVRPFDQGWTYYTGQSGGFHHRPRTKSSRNMMIPSNLALVAKRQTKERVFSSIWIVSKPINQGFFSIDPLGRESLFPLYRCRDADDTQGALVLSGTDSELSNLRADLHKTLRAGLRVVPTEGKEPEGPTPRVVFQYIYAVLHSPCYRERYSEHLKSDFPRVPLTRQPRLFQNLAELGRRLVGLHLLQAGLGKEPQAEYMGHENAEVERVSRDTDTVWIDRRQKCGFGGVPESVWNFHIGGYQVCEKWLKDRKGRTLSKDDIEHYQKIVVALAETIRIMKEIDEVIEQHGGWPGAFQTGKEGRQEPQLRKVAEERRAPYEPGDK